MTLTSWVKRSRKHLPSLASGLFALLMLAIVAHTALADLSDDLIAYYEMDDYTDQVGNYDMTTLSGSPQSSLFGRDGGSYRFHDENSDCIDTNIQMGGTPDHSFNLWVWFNQSAAVSSTFSGAFGDMDNGDNDGTMFRIYNSGSFINTRATFAGSGGSQVNLFNGPGDADYDYEYSWTMVTVVASSDSNNASLYLNGTLVHEEALPSTENDGHDVSYGVGCYWGDSANTNSQWEGYIDEIAVWNRTISQEEVQQLYNAGAGYFWDDINGGAPAGINMHTVHVADLFDDSDLSGVNVTLDSGPSNLTDGSGNARFFNLSGDQDFTASLTGYWDVAGTVSVNTTEDANMSQGHVDISSITTIITGDVLGAALGTWTVNTTAKTYDECPATYPCDIHLADGSNALTLQYTGGGDYLPTDFIVEITAPENTTTTVANVSDTDITINATSALSGIGVSNFTITVSNASESYETEYETTDGNLTFPGLQGVCLFILMNATGYALDNTTICPNTTAESHTFTLYTENSVSVTILDEDSGLPIYEEINIVVTGSNFSQTNSTNTSLFYIDGLYEDTYSFKFSNSNYSLKTYYVTVGGRSHQTLTAYLSLNTEEVTFSFLDFDTGASLEDVTTTMTRLINSTWTVVSTKTSDITGRSQFTYTPTVKYCFESSKTLYDTRSYCFDPILFSEYVVRLTKQASLDEDQDYTGVILTWTPTEWTANTSVNFSLIIASPKGLLTTYSYNLSWPSNTSADAGINSYGEEFDVPVTIGNPSGFAYVNLTITYNTTIGIQRTFTYRYLIQNTYEETSFKANKDNTYGLGLITRAIITVLLVIVMGGIASLIGGPLIGGAVGLTIMGYLISIGFMPWWAGAVSIVVGVIILMSRSSQ